MHARDIIGKFGGQSALAKMLGTRQSTVSHWAQTGMIPPKRQSNLLNLAKFHGIELEPIDFMVQTESNESAPRGEIAKEINVLVPQSGTNPRNDQQLRLDLQIEKQIEIDGIGMGVLSDGTAFLNGRGLARLCGIDSSRISEMAADWQAGTLHLTMKVREILSSRGITVEHPYIAINQRTVVFHAYSDVLCVAVLEYYAFDAPNVRDDAKKNYRLLAGKALHDFIYTQVGYDPNANVPEAWKQFHDRVSLTYNSVPAGYFGIFKEIADMIVTLGQNGLHIDSKFVPDISVGLAWAKHWDAATLANLHGERIKFKHNYPAYFPQSASNPQEPWCYPEAALGEFRRWFRESYIGDGKFKKYLESKVLQKQLPASFAQLAIASYIQE